MKRVIMCLKLLRNNMNLFVETSLSDLYICLFTKNFKVVDKIHVPNLAKKTDEFFEHLDILLQRNKLELSNIKKVYTTLGPGSFNGARIGFLFARTIVQMNNACKLYVAPTFVLFKIQFLIQGKKLDIKIKANKYSLYDIQFSNQQVQKSLINNDGNYDLLNYQLLEKRLRTYLNFFNYVNQSDLLNVELEYLSDPQIGEI